MKTYFQDNKLNYQPFIRTFLYDPLSDKSIEVELVVDTGFQGGVLIPLRIYVELGLNLFEEPMVIAQTAVGDKIELRVSRALIRINDMLIPCSAYTTLGVKKALLGREVLMKTGLLYKPPDEIRVGLR